MTRVPILWPPPRLRDRLSLLAHRIYQIRQAVCDRLVLEDASCDIPFLTIIGQGLTVDWLSKERIRLQVMSSLSIQLSRQQSR